MTSPVACRSIDYCVPELSRRCELHIHFSFFVSKGISDEQGSNFTLHPSFTPPFIRPRALTVARRHFVHAGDSSFPVRSKSLDRQKSCLSY